MYSADVFTSIVYLTKVDGLAANLLGTGDSPQAALLSVSVLLRPVLLFLLAASSWSRISLGHSPALGRYDHRLIAAAVFVAGALSLTIYGLAQVSPRTACVLLLVFWSALVLSASVAFISLGVSVWSARVLARRAQLSSGSSRTAGQRVPLNSQRAPRPLTLGMSPSGRLNEPATSGTMTEFGALKKSYEDLDTFGRRRPQDDGAFPKASLPTTGLTVNTHGTGASAVPSSTDAYGIEPASDHAGGRQAAPHLLVPIGPSGTRGSAQGTRRPSGASRIPIASFRRSASADASAHQRAADTGTAGAAAAPHLATWAPYGNPAASNSGEALLQTSDYKAPESADCTPPQPPSPSLSAFIDDRLRSPEKGGDISYLDLGASQHPVGTRQDRSPAGSSRSCAGAPVLHTQTNFDGTFGTSSGSPDASRSFTATRSPARSMTPVSFAATPATPRNGTHNRTRNATEEHEPGYVTVRSLRSFLSGGAPPRIEHCVQGGGEDLLGASGAVWAAIEAAHAAEARMLNKGAVAALHADDQERLSEAEARRALVRIGGYLAGVLLPFVSSERTGDWYRSSSLLSRAWPCHRSSLRSSSQQATLLRRSCISSSHLRSH